MHDSTDYQADAAKLELFGQRFRANAYAVYARLRAEQPVLRRSNQRGSSATCFVTRYDDVAALLRDSRRFVKDIRNTMTPGERAALPEPPPYLRLLSHHMLNLDGDDHNRLRGLVNKAFTTRIVEQLQGRIETIAHDLIDTVQRRGHADLIETFALPLPIIVIAELLGIPAKDRGRFRTWSHALVSPTTDITRPSKKAAATRRLMEDLVAYLRTVFAARRARPGDDLISLLLAAEEAGDVLSEEELYAMILLLIVVGHETTVNLIVNGVLALLQHPDQLLRLHGDRSLLPGAVEEMLRYDCPVERAPMRFAAEDVTVAGTRIRRGDAVSLVLGSANRDERQFAQADCFIIDRDPNRHLAFGLGLHYCLGAPLARLEGRIALAALLDRLPGLALDIAPEALRWRTNPIMRGLQRLPVRWTPGA
jgi:cytochrome P450 PksS